MFKSLSDWLVWQAGLHPRSIDLGLARCRTVARRLNVLSPAFPIVTVAGTNGKGSSVAMLEAILSAAGYRVGCFSSPHLLRYNERVRVGGQCVSDEALCQAFFAVNAAREVEAVSLTFFEFGTLAAMWLFFRRELDIAILEVGLGGRLDAVNIFDPSVALITPIGIDHVAWLGPDRECIGFEKAGIFRENQLAVCNDFDPPQRLLDYARQLSVRLFCLGRDFFYQPSSKCRWDWIGDGRCFRDLPLPNLAGQFQVANAAGVLMVLDLLSSSFPMPQPAVAQGLSKVFLPGRVQVLSGRVLCIVDVAHNVLGVRALKAALVDFPCSGDTHALVGVLEDKDSVGMFAVMDDVVQHWHVAPVASPRGASVEHLVEQLHGLGVSSIQVYVSVATAVDFLLESVPTEDRIVVFGSFFTVAEVLGR